MNNAIKINTRSYNSERDILTQLFGVAYKSAVGFYNVFCFAVYVIGYMFNEVRKFTKTKTARGMVIFYKLYVRMWIHAGAFYATVVALFGTEFGLVALSLSIPVVVLRLLTLSESCDKRSRNADRK